MVQIQELNGSQSREIINTQQRFQHWQESKRKLGAYRGSMVWVKGAASDYLARSAYDDGRRRQKSLGKRSPETEALKSAFDKGREAAHERLKAAEESLASQTAINRALALGRVPLLVAAILRVLDKAGLLGQGVRALGTNALYAYEAAAGVRFVSEILATDDLDLLYDAGAKLHLHLPDGADERSILALLRKADRSFQKTTQPFRASNRSGFMVDLIKPQPRPVFRNERARIGDDAQDDIDAAEIEGLIWLKNTPAFNAIALDERGAPLMIETVDPRGFAIHKLWLSDREDRNPAKRRRDKAQAAAVADLCVQYFPHLPFPGRDLGAIPSRLIEAAKPLFDPRAAKI